VGKTQRTEETARPSPPTRHAADDVAIRHRPGVVAAAGALLGLSMGVVLGRATVDVPSEPRLVSEELRSAAAAPPAAAFENVSPSVGSPNAPPTEPGDRFRLQLGRQVVREKPGQGFGKHDVAGRPVARLTDQESKLRFPLQATAGEYGLTAILHLDGKTRGTAQSSLNGQALSPWVLDPGWGAYYSPVSRDLLTRGEHELAIVVKDPPGSASVSMESVAVSPTESQVVFTLGSEAVGRLIDGFANPEGESVWSIGPRSSIGVVLAPLAAPYRLTVRGIALADLDPVAVRGQINGTDIGSADFTRKMAESSWNVPAHVLRPGLNRVEFSYSKTGQPANFDPQSQDKRLLAVRFARVALVPER
jgi:hypothetical protein